MRVAQFEVDAIRADGSTGNLWTTEETLNAVNIAMERAARIMRLAGAQALTVSLKSTDPSTTYVTGTYDPGSLTITAGTTDYTLPPDFVTVISILPIDAEFDEVRFIPAELYQRAYADNRTIQDVDLMSVENTPATYRYTIIGERTLRISPTPQDTFDIELLYRYRPAKLQVYSLGVIKTTNLSASVHGVGVTWQTAGLRVPIELVVGPNAVDLNQYYQRVSSFTSETDLTLTYPWQGESFPYGTAYKLASVPPLPEEHHQWLAQMAAAIMLRKVSIKTSEDSKASLEAQLEAEVKPELTVRQSNESIAVEPFQVTR